MRDLLHWAKYIQKLSIPTRLMIIYFSLDLMIYLVKTHSNFFAPNGIVHIIVSAEMIFILFAGCLMLIGHDYIFDPERDINEARRTIAHVIIITAIVALVLLIIPALNPAYPQIDRIPEQYHEKTNSITFSNNSIKENQLPYPSEMNVTDGSNWPYNLTIECSTDNYEVIGGEAVYACHWTIFIENINESFMPGLKESRPRKISRQISDKIDNKTNLYNNSIKVYWNNEIQRHNFTKFGINNMSYYRRNGSRSLIFNRGEKRIEIRSSRRVVTSTDAENERRW